MGLEDPQAGSRAHERFQKITEQAHRATKLTSQILAFARRQVLQPRKLNLNTSVVDVTSLLHKLIGDRVDIRALSDESLRVTMADPAQIEQVLMNLCINARDAMPDGGVLMIESATCRLAPNTRVLIRSPVPATTYCSASPIPAPAWTKPPSIASSNLFSPPKKWGREPALGLSTVYGIVKQHGRFIYVYSEPGQGTAFRLYFPCCDGIADQAELKAPVELRRGKETILLADDHDGLRQSAHEMLRDLGYGVLTAANGREAVELFKANAAALIWSYSTS